VLVTREEERRVTDKPKQASTYQFAEDVGLTSVPPGSYVIHVVGRSSLDKEKAITRDVPVTVR
jgi:hypothetical protein